MKTPENKRLVIEYISASCRLLKGLSLDTLSIETVVDSFDVNHNLNLTDRIGGITANPLVNRIEIAQLTRIYADAGSVITARAFANASSHSNLPHCNFNFSGKLININ